MNSRILLASLALAIAGCASTPADRIEKDRAAFAGGRRPWVEAVTDGL